MRTELVADALRAAARDRGGLDGAIFHSDHGAQYGGKQFADLCAELGVVQSMGAVGSSADNAAAESFNATLKRETLQGRTSWSTRLEVFRWASRYNTRRRHSRLGQRAPQTYETAFHSTSSTLASAA